LEGRPGEAQHMVGLESLDVGRPVGIWIPYHTLYNK